VTFERGLTVGAQGILLPCKAIAFVATRLRVRTEAPYVVGTRPPESALARPSHAEPRSASQETDAVAHAEKMAGAAAAMRLLGPAGVEGDRKREREKKGELLAGPHGHNSTWGRQTYCAMAGGATPPPL
jgi:hypothetical protein